VKLTYFVISQLPTFYLTDKFNQGSLAR
jgi:hypothetical protein